MPVEDYYQTRIDNDERNGVPYPSAGVGLLASFAAFEAAEAECWNCGEPHDDWEDRLCTECRDEIAACKGTVALMTRAVSG